MRCADNLLVRYASLIRYKHSKLAAKSGKLLYLVFSVSRNFSPELESLDNAVFDVETASLRGPILSCLMKMEIKADLEQTGKASILSGEHTRGELRLA
ncbi:hypothetical protein AVEN_238372-1 [Araneus ventricosus]|uniref:Uncharacterized protein n=1 Tax=Araneus ventricosus TaxID=182803 RepID=A0A4Y2K9G0_ARAVE|nr:hypothetical protein AVEN_238372-1 [Araneus ventricosus]